MAVIELRRQLEMLTESLDRLDGVLALALSPPARESALALQRQLRVELGEAVDSWLRLGGGLILEDPVSGQPGDEQALEDDDEELAEEAAELEVEQELAPPVEEELALAVDEEVDEEFDTVETPIVAPEPVAPGALSALQHHFHSAAVSDTPTQAASDWLPRFRRVVGQTLPSDKPSEERMRVVRAVNACDAWRVFSADVQAALIAAMGLRLRALQEAGHDDGSLGPAFSRLTAFLQRERPAFVYGLARDHRPRSGSWSADADDAWDALLELLPEGDADTAAEPAVLLRQVEDLVEELDLAPHTARSAVRAQLVLAVRAALEGGVSARDTRLVRCAGPLHDELAGREFRALRRAIRDAISDEVEDDPADAGHVVPPDWGWWQHTRGRRAMLIGGSPREPNRRRIETTFAFAELTWERTLRKPQALTALQTRIRQRSVDLVIILGRFVGHSYDDILLPACRESDVAWVHVDHGYGTVRIQQCIERFLAEQSGVSSGMEG